MKPILRPPGRRTSTSRVTRLDWVTWAGAILVLAGLVRFVGIWWSQLSAAWRHSVLATWQLPSLLIFVGICILTFTLVRRRRQAGVTEAIAARRPASALLTLAAVALRRLRHWLRWWYPLLPCSLPIKPVSTSCTHSRRPTKLNRIWPNKAKSPTHSAQPSTRLAQKSSTSAWAGLCAATDHDEF